MAFTVPPGGLQLWARWDDPSDDRQRLDAAVAAGVLVGPGRLYGAPDGFLRLSYARVDEATATEGIRRLRAMLPE
jgi:DNA-binding transcriptional MocR family regulator